MMGGGAGQGMMGRGGFAGDPALCNGQNYDPAAMATREESMLVNRKAVLTNLEAQLAAATDANVKATLTSRIELQKIQLNWAEGRVSVVKALPSDWLTGAISLAKYDVDFFTKTTANDVNNQKWITLRLQNAQAHLTALEAQVKQ